MTEEGIIYGLIGTSLSHSFSMDFFNQKFISEGINAQYFNFELNDIGELMTIFSEYPNLDGLNVTMPYKEKVIPFMDQLDETAEMVGAVNVIKIIKGKNSIEPLLTSEMDKALVLGTGGSSKAVKAGLESLGLTVDFVSRRKTATTITYEELTKQMINAHKVIVNTTPLGTYPNTDVCPDIPYRFLTPSHLCYDLVYNPSETMFMKNSAAAGAVVKNGLEMLLLQAFESYRIWTEG